MPETKLEAARRTGNLVNVITAMREQAAAETTDAPAGGRPEMNEIDGAIALAAHLSAQGTKGAERRQAMKDVRPGVTIGAKGVEKTKRTYAQQLEKALAWANTLTESQRHDYITGEKFEALPDHAQGLVAEAFGTVDDDDELVLEDTVGEPFDAATYDYNAELVEPDSLAGDDDATDDPAEPDYGSIFEDNTTYEEDV